jgi:hypothetical protein
MKRRQFISGASAAVAATVCGLPSIASAVPEAADGALVVSPDCAGYSKAGVWVGRGAVLQIGDGMGNWKMISDLKTLTIGATEFA